MFAIFGISATHKTATRDQFAFEFLVFKPSSAVVNIHSVNT